MRNTSPKENRKAVSRGSYGSDKKTHLAVLPAYNEAKHIAAVVSDIFSTELIDDVVVVDDASTDDTTEEAESAGARVLRNEVNRQNGGAVKRGYAKALELGADVVYRLDADGQHNPRDLSKFQRAMRESDCEYVLGNRFADPDCWSAMPWDRLFGNLVVGVATSLRTRNRILDPSCGFRAIAAPYLRKVPYDEFADDFRMDIQELIALEHLGGRLQQVPVDCIYENEESSLSYADGLRLLFSSVFFSPLENASRRGSTE